ncbi:MAG: MAPEG family protein [Pseudomonadota bacterium]|nr:MAPEG family protein [Pseudomonadota bacterium]
MTLAYWCVLIAALLPYFTVMIAKSNQGFDNHDPRAWLGRLGGRPARAHAAHLNAFEAFPFFAAAVIIAHQLHAYQGWINALAALFIVARIGYVACYLADLATLRSLVWVVGIGLNIAIFLLGAF